MSSSDPDPALVSAVRALATATLTVALVGTSGKPWSPLEVLDVYEDFYHLLYPNAGSGAYQAWRTTSDERLKKVRGPSS
ncbi:hypothetical protein [Bradyrhizobium sp. CCBAU 051011]|uniref:hypothetical protein n=1 Tax=Bradyrhizobium sp. CCBAU 051011 TaxID=858422 RepID=UPI001379707E|nr:hypothetical protein [Bradyrhizobium sp. CCBAU 051011]